MYKKKSEVIAEKRELQIVAARGYDKYFLVDSHEELLKIIKNDKAKIFFEYISKECVCTMYFDIDIDKEKDIYYFEKDMELIEKLKRVVNEEYRNYKLRWIILESHSQEKKSYHIIVRMQDNKGSNVYFKNYNVLKQHVKNYINLIDTKAIDTIVYRDGLFRTLYSSKPKENRPFIKSETSDDFDEVESFVTYTVQNEQMINIIINETTKLKEIVDTIDIAESYEDWMKVGFSIIDYCKQNQVDMSEGLDHFKMYSKRNQEKYNESHTEDQWRNWTEREYNGNKITQGTILKMFKDKQDTHLLRELDVISNNSSVSIHAIKHFEVLAKTRASIKALMESKGLNPIHDLVSKNCRGASLYSECNRDGYKICCKNCDFEYPPVSIPVDRALAPTVFNLLVINSDENINNKDTSQVAKKILDYKNLIYTLDNKWFLYNNNSGIYENKVDLEILNEMEKVVESMTEDGFEEEWFSWVHKVNYKENLLKELKIKSFKRVELDDDDFLLGFEDGVLDLKKGEFRKGGINEYVTMKCGVPYDENADTSLVQEMLKGVFPDDAEREYALNKFALCLEGYNREQMITFNYAYTASNGKSFIMERLRQVLGDYGGTFPVTLLTGKMKGAGEANSSLIDFNKKRFMYCSEPEAGAKLNTNFVKLLTGDKVKGRGLYSAREIEMSPTWKLFVNCNVLPNFDVYDEGIARRIEIMEYKTKFCESPKKKNERLLKKYTREEEHEIECGLIKILVERYVQLRDVGYKYIEPKVFCSIRKMYINDNKDVIRDLLLENFEKGGSMDYVKMINVKNVLKTGGVKEKDVITIQKIVEDLFEGVEYKECSKVQNVSVRSYFLGLRFKG
jgi:P4 family phage/plasmid primase-like protien